jgi:hypothetical protein
VKGLSLACTCWEDRRTSAHDFLRHVVVLSLPALLELDGVGRVKLADDWKKQQREIA